MAADMSILKLPLHSDDCGVIYDADCHEVCDAWGLDEEADLAGTVTATTHTLGERSASAAARAAEVCRRVNLHDDLVAMLERTADEIGRADFGTVTLLPQIEALVKRAKVEGR